jgi:hypothetical protein
MKSHDKNNAKADQNPEDPVKDDKPLEKEIGGYEAQGLLEPTRYNDWEVKGRCSDF